VWAGHAIVVVAADIARSALDIEFLTCGDSFSSQLLAPTAALIEIAIGMIYERFFYDSATRCRPMFYVCSEVQECSEDERTRLFGDARSAASLE
jgi:hypothetical protein